MKREAEILSKAHSYVRILAIPLLIFMLLLLVERHFPKRIIDQEVSFVKYPSGGGFYKLGKYPVLVKAHYTPCLKKGDTVDVYLGRIFGLVTEVGTSTACENYTLSKFKGDKGYIITPSDGLFGRLSFLIYLIILLIVILWLDPNSETGNGAFIFAIGLSLFVFTLFTKLFL